MNKIFVSLNSFHKLPSKKHTKKLPEAVTHELPIAQAPALSYNPRELPIAHAPTLS